MEELNKDSLLEIPKLILIKDLGMIYATENSKWKNDFMPFYNWAMLNGYEENKGLSIDRIDNARGYEPNNCRWVDRTIQSRNQRMPKNNTSGYKGVSFYKNYKMFEARIHINKKCVRLGSFSTAVEGAIAYNNYIIENNLEGFILNEIPKEGT